MIDEPCERFTFVFIAGAAGERQRMQDVLQMAWTFVNDRLVFFVILIHLIHKRLES